MGDGVGMGMGTDDAPVGARHASPPPSGLAPTVVMRGYAYPTTNDTLVVPLPPMFSVATRRAPRTW